MKAPSPTATPAWVMALTAMLACCVPTLLAYSVSPSSTFFNQTAAVIGWGVFLSVVLHQLAAARRFVGTSDSGSTALHAALVLLILSVGAACALRGLPLSLAMSHALMLLAALLAAWGGAMVTRAAQGAAVFHVLAWGFVVAGMLGACVSVVQVFAPTWADGQWLAISALPGRATGNLRQPNHLGSLLLWALVGVVALMDFPLACRGASAVPGDSGSLVYPARSALGWGAGLALVFGIVLTASRTSALGLFVLAAWGLFDQKLSARARVLLLATPLLYALMWLALTQWADATGHAFGGAARFSVQGDVSSSRFGIWANALTLVAQQPWLGVGWGNFNFSWSLTPFPNRPVAFFDHAHNLFLQLLVELGVPLASLVLVLLGWAFYKAGLAAWRAAPGAPPLVLRSCFVMLLLMALHSQLEYPLWYAYFFLPTAFLWGLCLGGEGHASEVTPTRAVLPALRGLFVLRVAAGLMVIVGAIAVLDYWRVAIIFAPPPGAAPLAKRIAAGQQSWFFAHQAHYAAATTSDSPQEVMASFAVTTHHLLDTRLMVAWAKALNAHGDVERAQHLAARLREFRNRNADSFFAPCTQIPAPVPMPFQCVAPIKTMDWRAFQ